MSISRLRLHLRTKKTSLLLVSIISHFEIVQIIGLNTREIILSAFFGWTTDNFQALLKGIFSWVCFLPFAGKHRSRTVCNPFYIDFIRCFGGQVSWDETSGIGSTYTSNDDGITHHLVDRPTITNQRMDRYLYFHMAIRKRYLFTASRVYRPFSCLLEPVISSWKLVYTNPGFWFSVKIQCSLVSNLLNQPMRFL